MTEISEDRAQSYKVKLEIFEGPLDLLLHLIRINKINIYDIPIIEITRQYHEYLDLMEEMNFEIAGEFLVMASTLLYLKSKMLLPGEETSDEEEEREDPRMELARQLMDYQQMRAASESLMALEKARSLIWSRTKDSIINSESDEFIEASLFDLIGAFKLILQKRQAEEKMELKREDFSVTEKISFIKSKLSYQDSIDFFSLFPEESSRKEKIVIFLALLELVRHGIAGIIQGTTDHSIMIFRRASSMVPVP